MPAQMTAFAPAKVNLALHVTGKRPDGYHLLDSLVVFAQAGDRLHIRRAETAKLTVTGPFAEGVPTGPENLIWKAHALVDGAPPLDIHLEKNLPHAAGIGGGSADAAAVLRALTRDFGCATPPPQDILSLGADVPVCLTDQPQCMQGIGETLAPAPPLPELHLVLVNPGVSVPTGPVFMALETVNGAPLAPMDWGDGQDAQAHFLDWLTAQRNDLQAPARALVPEVEIALDALRETDGCHLARMSGSGATCFGLYLDPAAAQRAADAIKTARPDWWVVAAPVLGTAGQPASA
jgi:4-diphosphocytidyl-2-C-methyl-D-erythritol kinase